MGLINIFWIGPEQHYSGILIYQMILCPSDTEFFRNTLLRTYSLRDTTLILPEDESNFDPYFYEPEFNEVDQFESVRLDKNGSITRGVLFGNNQNLSVNSSLDLQLNGQLTDRIKVLASVSDANIPIQPEGNTQQLQDFDNIFIQLYDDRSTLTAGDF